MQNQSSTLATGNPLQHTTETAQPSQTQHEFVSSSLLDLTEEQLARVGSSLSQQQMLDSGRLTSSSFIWLQILGATASPRTVARASCVCRQLKAAADAAFM